MPINRPPCDNPRDSATHPFVIYRRRHKRKSCGSWMTKRITFTQWTSSDLIAAAAIKLHKSSLHILSASVSFVVEFSERQERIRGSLSLIVAQNRSDGELRLKVLI